MLMTLLLSQGPVFGQNRLPSDDPTLRPYQLKVANYIDRCEKEELSNVEQSECLHDQVKALNDILKTEIGKAERLNNEMAVDKGKYGGDSKQTGRLLRNDLRNSQAAWQTYTDKFCGSVSNRYEILGGTGGAVDGNRCAIRHLVQRINELRG